MMLSCDVSACETNKRRTKKTICQLTTSIYQKDEQKKAETNNKKNNNKHTHLYIYVRTNNV